MKNFIKSIIASILIGSLTCCTFDFTSKSNEDDDYVKEIFKFEPIDGFEDYKEACAAGNFEVAHRFLAQIPKDQFDFQAKRVYEEAATYILTQEASFLISLGDDQSITRLVFLIKQSDIDDWMVGDVCNKVIDLAIAVNNEKALSRLIYIHPEKDSWPLQLCENIVNYYSQIEKENAKSFITSNLSAKHVSDIGIKYCIEHNDMDFLQKIFTNTDKNKFSEESMYKLIVYYYQQNPAKAVNFIVSNISNDNIAEAGLRYCEEYNDKQTLQKILTGNSEVAKSNLELVAKIDINKFKSCLSRVRQEAEERVPKCPGYDEFLSTPITDAKYFEFERYISAVKGYNSECTKLINLALEMGCKQEAKKIVSQMKPNLDLTDKRWSDTYETYLYKVTLNEDDIEYAKKLVE